MKDILKVHTNAIIIGDTIIKADGNTIYELTLVDNKTYSVIFYEYYYGDCPHFGILIEINDEYTNYLLTSSIDLDDVSNSIVKCVDTGKSIK